jgi:2-oxoglutarate ferredoxin oxidoreductase subunit gamma
MIPEYPLGVFKDEEGQWNEPRDNHGGFGGQGIMLIGTILTYAGKEEGKAVSWLPSYGPEMRGGTANCAVCVSDEGIASPVVVEPTAAVVMNLPSFDKFYRL